MVAAAAVLLLAIGAWYTTSLILSRPPGGLWVPFVTKDLGEKGDPQPREGGEAGAPPRREILRG